MRRAFKFRLYPNVNQRRELEIMLETHRRLYNEFLAQRKAAYDTEKKTLKSAEQSRWYTDTHGIRATDPSPWYRKLNRQSVQGLLKRLDRAFQAFFRRVKAGQKPGYPRFKGCDHFDGFEFLNYGKTYGIQLDGNHLNLKHVGQIKVKLHREIRGTIKTVAVKRESDKWYVVFSCDLGEVAVEPSVNPPVGIDMGLKHFFSKSDGTKPEPNPRYLNDALPELRRRSRAVSRKKRGGKNRRKAVKRLAAIHAKVRNLRGEHHHQTALKLVRRYGFIAVERLDIKGMLEERGASTKSGTRRLNRAISDAAWGGFVDTLRCKAESAGVSVVDVDPRGTTQGCSGCGRIVPKTLRDRWHECPHCGLSLDRDENAARNILARALPARIGPAGHNPGVAPGGPKS
jgi:putative transposase